MGPVPEQGDVHWVVLGGRGHVERGGRYAVVVSDEAYNHHSTVVIVPLSSSTWEDELHPATVVKGTHTRAMVEQVRVVDRRDLGQHAGNLAGTTVMSLILEQLRYLFALDQEGL